MLATLKRLDHGIANPTAWLDECTTFAIGHSSVSVLRGTGASSQLSIATENVCHCLGSFEPHVQGLHLLLFKKHITLAEVLAWVQIVISSSRSPWRTSGKRHGET